MDSNALLSNDSALMDGVGRLLRGIQRRLLAAGENGHGSRPQLVFYVREGEEEEDNSYSYSGIHSHEVLAAATSHDLETMVDDLLRLALLSGRGRGKNRDGGGDDGGAIETLEELEREVDIVVLPYTSDDGRLPVPDAGIISSPLLATPEKELPLSALRTLTSHVYAALLSDAGAASDGSDAEIEFDVVDVTSREDDDNVSAGPFEGDEDYEEYEDEVEALSDGVQKQPEGTGLYDVNYDDDYYVDSVHESSAEFVAVDDEEQDEEDDVAPTVTSLPQQPQDVYHDHDNISDEEAESHGPMISDEPSPVLEEKIQDILVELETITRRIQLDCQGKMSNLEAKQDDVLLDPDKSMPILEFGRDAQNILEGAIDSFQDAAEAIVSSGEGDIDNDFDAQAEGKRAFLGSFSRVYVYDCSSLLKVMGCSTLFFLSLSFPLLFRNKNDTPQGPRRR